MAASDQAIPKAPTASLVVIGDEILSGKVQDANSAYLAKALYELGVRLCQITTVGDDDAAIGEAVRRGSAGHHWVFTCGGIGPTHDDITIAAIANAFGVKTVIHPELKRLLEGHYGTRLTADHLRMAEVPAGTELIPVPALRHPQLLFGNVFIFPGVPRLFRLKFEAIQGALSPYSAPLRRDLAPTGRRRQHRRHLAPSTSPVRRGADRLLPRLRGSPFRHPHHHRGSRRHLARPS